MSPSKNPTITISLNTEKRLIRTGKAALTLALTKSGYTLANTVQITFTQ